MKATGAQHLVEALRINGVARVFCVPGESYLAALDALYDVRGSVHLITCRHEAAAANMAEATGKLTGAPGIAFVTRGPGAAHAAIAVHTAFQDSPPMILFVGQVARSQRRREAFQEIDYEAMFAPVAKYVERIDDAARVPEILSRAFHTALNGRPGPVVIELPEDMLREEAEAEPAPRARRAEAAPTPEALEEIAARLGQAERPFVIAGGGGWTPQAVADLRRLAEEANLPVGLSFRCKDYLDNRHPNYAGDVGIGINPALRERILASDLVLAIGPRLGEITAGGYTLFEVPRPKQALIHIHPGAEELGRVYAADLMVNATMPAALRALCGLSMDGGRWADWTAAAHADYEAFRAPVTVTGRANPSHIFAHLDSVLPDDAIVTNGAGNYAAWLHRFYRHKSFRTQLGPTSGAMGYGLPAALAAKAACPGRTVVAVAGDGCFSMASPELATAAAQGLNVIVLVVNNGAYGTIRMHQERDYPGRVMGTDCFNPDFTALARAYGCYAARVAKTEDFAPTLEAALGANRPALIEIMTDAEDIAPGRTLSQLRGPTGPAG